MQKGGQRVNCIPKASLGSTQLPAAGLEQTLGAGAIPLERVCGSGRYTSPSIDSDDPIFEA